MYESGEQDKQALYAVVLKDKFFNKFCAQYHVFLYGIAGNM